MFQNTEGILIKKTSYSGNGFILKVYTQQSGIKTYFARKNKKQKNALQPLSIIGLSSTNNPKKTIQNCNEINVAKNYNSIYSDIIKSNIFLFLNEVLNNVLIEEQENESMYKYIEKSLLDFDKKELDINFHLTFLMGLTQFLGFEPDLGITQGYFDFEEGTNMQSAPIHKNHLNKLQTVLFSQLNELTFNTEANFKFTNQERKELINILVSYYGYHTNMRELKSLPVLEMVFS
jgi:DNA repair protein RecO (recombination protein O)